MKITNFINKENLRFRLFGPLFNRKPPKMKSDSVDQLLREVDTKQYQEKINALIKNDLLLRYTPQAVENSLKTFELFLKPKVKSEPNYINQVETIPIKQQTAKVRTNEILTEEKKQEVWKVKKRIPKWFRNPHQINTRILVAYMELLGDNNSVPVYKLEVACQSIKTFQTNYSQMKIIAERNHAKVFEESGGRITLWEPVRTFIHKEYKNY